MIKSRTSGSTLRAASGATVTQDVMLQLIMKQIFKSKVFWLSFTLFAMGIAFGYFENTFYQYIDEEGVLIESWFMPLSFLCILIGGIGLFFVAVKAIWLAIKRSA